LRSFNNPARSFYFISVLIQVKKELVISKERTIYRILRFFDSGGKAKLRRVPARIFLNG
jgi:hypothetical protein